MEIPESDDKDEVCAAVAANVLWQMESDRKSGSLQQLYSHMWREAYKTKAVMSEYVSEGYFNVVTQLVCFFRIYEDVVPCIQDWLAQDMKVYVFTSDSVESQKLLFGFSDKGDLVEVGSLL